MNTTTTTTTVNHLKTEHPSAPTTSSSSSKFLSSSAVSFHSELIGWGYDASSSLGLDPLLVLWQHCAAEVRRI